MCPLCIGTVTLLVTGAAPASGLVAVALKKFRTDRGAINHGSGATEHNEKEKKNGVSQEKGSSRNAT